LFKIKRIIIALILIVLLIPVVSCAKGEPDALGGVTVIITDGGISQTAADVMVENYHKGARADVSYLISNDTDATISPNLYSVFKVNPGDYSKTVGYKTVPTYYSDWLDIPKCGDIKPGESKSYTIVLSIPDNKEEVPDQWAFRTGVAGNNGGFVQTGTELWWRINMR